MPRSLLGPKPYPIPQANPKLGLNVKSAKHSETTMPLKRMPKAEETDLKKELKDVIQNLYELMVQVDNYGISAKVNSTKILEKQFEIIHQALEILHASSTTLNVIIPQEVIQYVDAGRNPDIYTREFVELARSHNQKLKGKMEAFASFRDVLAEQMFIAMPELREDIKKVVDNTSGTAGEIEKRALGGGKESSS